MFILIVPEWELLIYVRRDSHLKILHEYMSLIDIAAYIFTYCDAQYDFLVSVWSRECAGNL